MNKKKTATQNLPVLCTLVLIFTGFTAMRWIWIFLIFVVACSHKSPDYFLAQGRSINQELLEEMQQIDDLDGLIEALPRMQKLYGRLVDVIVEAKKWQIRHKTSWQPTSEDTALSQQLSRELERLYQMPTARAILEKAQETALIRLDSLEKK